jgi:KipI family sensor histidine kinase inhibitor
MSDAAPGPSSGARIEAFGDAGLLVVLGDATDDALNRRAHAIAAAVEAARSAVAGLGRPVPAQASVLVPVDPRRIALVDAAARLTDLVVAGFGAAGAAGPLAAASNDELARAPGSDAVVEIPVRYGGADGPDLAEVAERCGLGEAAVVALHAGTTYRVRFLGFAPGFAYLGPLDPALALPRRATPRERIPAGSVAIAGDQTAVYPGPLPGGWHVIGRTDRALFDPTTDPPSLLQPGDAVRLVPAG